MPVQEPCRRHRTDPPNTRISICRVAHEGEEVGNQGGFYPELPANSFRITDLPPSAVSLHDPLSAHALRQVLIGRPDTDLLDGRVL